MAREASRWVCGVVLAIGLVVSPEFAVAQLGEWEDCPQGQELAPKMVDVDTRLDELEWEKKQLQTDFGEWNGLKNQYQAELTAAEKEVRKQTSISSIFSNAGLSALIVAQDNWSTAKGSLEVATDNINKITFDFIMNGRELRRYQLIKKILESLEEFKLQCVPFSLNGLVSAYPGTDCHPAMFGSEVCESGGSKGDRNERED